MAAKQEVLAVDVLSEIERMVYAKVEDAHCRFGGLSGQQQNTLTNVYLSQIGPAVIEKYAGQGCRIRGIRHLQTMIHAAEFDVGHRRGIIDSGAGIHMPQWCDEQFDYSMGREGQVGLHAHTPGAQSEEDFRFGLPPMGGRYVAMDLVTGKHDGTPQPEYSDHTELREERYRERARQQVRRPFQPRGRSVEEILANLPRKHRIDGQTYVLDVKETLQAAGINPISPGYGVIEARLREEQEDPKERDKLQRLYAEIEFKGAAEEADDKFDREKDD